MSVPRQPPRDWSPDSWRDLPRSQSVEYPDGAALARAVAQLSALPPLVTPWEVGRLRSEIAEAQQGRRFFLQGGDCAESFADCRADIITNRLKVMLQMSVVLIQAGRRPVVRVGRFAGQYAKPRSSPLESRGSATLPSYFGDLVNQPEFDAAARRADPRLLVEAYWHAALTLNFVRSLGSGGFSDLHHPEYWDLSFMDGDDVADELKQRYRDTTRQLTEALRFMSALGETRGGDLTRVDFYTSHEGLSLEYEAAQTRESDHHPGHYDLTTHLPWIGERTRQLDGAHVEFFRGIENPVGVKLGPSMTADELLRLLDRLNPENDWGRLVLITRMGRAQVAERLPQLVQAVQREGRRVLWVSDPMHGNTIATQSGLKTRDFDDILSEVEQSFDVHEGFGSALGGVHLELTGEDVTECVGGGLSEADLAINYASLCDPRLNYRQALEMAFRIGERMTKSPSALGKLAGSREGG
ncbi:MAG: 3-deoxy-7-phosphoheptulonate synthase [Polyangiaceae bacterium]|nr:3-deoxy-7-phosphoheptulonate synthase [Polyangiaceae bacterium]MCW5789878.1 3-deoxy-7-phosphoheptulonate synthase [Polyangiaceae bacterium]